MNNYREVFQLAQDKGFYGLQKVEFIIERYNSEFATDTIVLIHATLIQKWLRDEHKIYFEIDARRSKNDSVIHRVAASRLIAGMVRRITTFESSVYEDALLNGIYHALGLIKRIKN